jgi:hypothetical protein
MDMPDLGRPCLQRDLYSTWTAELEGDENDRQANVPSLSFLPASCPPIHRILLTLSSYRNMSCLTLPSRDLPPLGMMCRVCDLALETSNRKVVISVFRAQRQNDRRRVMFSVSRPSLFFPNPG